MSSTFNKTNAIELNEDFQSLDSSLASSSFLNQNLLNYSPCQCSIYNESPTNNSPSTPSIPQLALVGLRNDLRQRNSSASSFSGSPVSKIDEEIDPINEFEFQTKINKSDLFFSISTHIAPKRNHESPFNSLLLSKSSAPCKIDKNKKLSAKSNLCPNFQKNDTQLNDRQQKADIRLRDNSINYLLNEHQSRPLSRSINTCQLDKPYEHNNTNVVYSNHYPSDYQRTRARSLK